MKLPVNLANNIFKLKFNAYDEIEVRIKGRAQRVEEPLRQVSGTIQPAGDKIQSLLPDGVMTDGAMIVHTSEQLFSYDSQQDQIERRQTFISYKNEVWKVHAIQNWSDHIQSSINRYLITKYVNLNDNSQ